MRAALAERVKPAVEPLGDVRHRAAEVTERPFDSRKPFGNAGKHERRGRERRVHEKADERHQPVLLHRLHADWRRWMDVQHSVEIVCHLVE